MIHTFARTNVQSSLSRILAVIALSVATPLATAAYVVGSGLDDTRCRLGSSPPNRMPKGVYAGRWYIKVHPLTPEQKKQQFTPDNMPPHVKTTALTGIAVFDGEGAFALRVSEKCEVRGYFDEKLKIGTEQFPVWRGKGRIRGNCTLPHFDPAANNFAFALRNMCGEPSMEFVANGEINTRKGESVGRSVFQLDNTIVEIQKKKAKQREADAEARASALKRLYGDSIPESEANRNTQ